MKNLYFFSLLLVAFYFGNCTTFWEQLIETPGEYYDDQEGSLPPERHVLAYDPVRAELMPFEYKANTYKSTQDTIYLYNPSFEDSPRCCVAPQGWISYGYIGETAPDIQPGSFEINIPAEDGNTYVSMVTRDNETNEGLIQKLPMPLKKGETYKFSIALAQSEILPSLSRTTGQEVNHTSPTQLIIGGLSDPNGKFYRLGISNAVATETWNEYNFTLQPEQDFGYLALMAYWEGNEATNGHICIDNCSAIVRVKAEIKNE